jgi:orotidine-5'-phosphate decarboxylase
MKFQQKIDNSVKKNNSLVCVGLDSDVDKIPFHLKKRKQPVFEFNKQIVDSTCDLVCAYKLNSAFYEAQGVEGIGQLKLTCDYLRNKYPEIPIILDAKRGDIGNTNKGYIKFVFEYLGADAITIHPYLGAEAIQPFLDQKDKGIIILCKTSNTGSDEFQNLTIKTTKTSLPTLHGRCSDGYLYQLVAYNVVKKWNNNNNCMLVVGATYPEELKTVRKIVGDITILVPGVGAQGGDLAAIMKDGLTKDKKGLIINSSRGIIFASSEKDFAERAREETKKLKDLINGYR